MIHDLRQLCKEFKKVKVMLPIDVRAQGQSICNAIYERRADSADVHELQQILEQYKYYTPNRLLNSWGITKLIASITKTIL